MEWEQDLIDAFETVVHRDFPNPERVGCPGSYILAQLVRRPADAQLSDLLEHVTECAPCFDDLKELRQGRIEGF